MGRDQAVAALADVGHPVYERPFGISVPAAYALVAQRYMHDYGTTLEDLAHVAVAHRRHATRNPRAQMRDPITVTAVMASRLLSATLRMLDCSTNPDGGTALIVSPRAPPHDLRPTPVLLRGARRTHNEPTSAM